MGGRQAPRGHRQGQLCGGGAPVRLRGPGRRGLPHVGQAQRGPGPGARHHHQRRGVRALHNIRHPHHDRQRRRRDLRRPAAPEVLHRRPHRHRH